jgi:hypothetical protein
MSHRHRSEEDLVHALDVGLDDDVLSDDYPIADVDAELIDGGADPGEVGRWGVALVGDLRKKRRLAWQEEARTMLDSMQAKLATHTRVAALPRADLLARIDAARRDPRLQGPVSMAARSLAGEASDEELRQILEDLEALALLADRKGDDKK